VVTYNMMKTKLLLGLLFVLPVISGCTQATLDNDYIKAQKLIDVNSNQYTDMAASGTLEDGVRVIRISAQQFNFDPALIIVNKGERVRLIIEVEDIPHGFEIEGFNIPGYDISTIIRKGTPLVLEFLADEAGVWEFICTIYCGFGHSEMKGTFVIR